MATQTARNQLPEEVRAALILLPDADDRHFFRLQDVLEHYATEYLKEKATRAQLESRVTALEAQLLQVTRERDDSLDAYEALWADHEDALEQK